jgi:hypothetical protein
MTYTFTQQGIERPFVPERDLFRLIKYGTYDLLELDGWTPELVPPGEITDEEYKLIDLWYTDIAGEEPMTFEEAFGD